VTLPGRRVLVVGAGLIGTSVGLALTAAGLDVQLSDPDLEHVRIAAELGAGRPADGGEPDVCVVATPPAATPDLCRSLLGQFLSATVTDVAGAKTYVQREIEALGAAMARRFVGGHPLAGRERSGPAAARADLFQGAPWVLTGSEGPARSSVAELVRACGAVPVYLSAEEHDRTVAATSHLPQLLASALAAGLPELPAEGSRLVGQGFRDMTRIADSDPELWAQLAAANSRHLAAAVAVFTAQLDSLGRSIAAGSTGAVADLVACGRKARAGLPGKHGGSALPYATVVVVVRDTPGQLGRLFHVAGEAGVNIEDVRVDHAPGLPLGLVSLSVEVSSAAALRATLTRHGWTVAD
jgi:prephenate dehydrogenase